jgi:hypothetical protein
VWHQASAPPKPVPTPVPAPGVEPADMAARWRAWREANGWTPRTGRYTSGTRRAGAAGRWHERRMARLDRVDPLERMDRTGRGEGPEAERAPRRRAGRSGTRRP